MIMGSLYHKSILFLFLPLSMRYENILSKIHLHKIFYTTSRLRVSSKRFPSAPYRHASPLEMTMLASAPLVISTEAKRSGEISPPSDGTGGITLGNLSTQSFIEAVPICPVPTCISARYDDVGEHPSRHFDRSGVEWRNLFL